METVPAASAVQRLRLAVAARVRTEIDETVRSLIWLSKPGRERHFDVVGTRPVRIGAHGSPSMASARWPHPC